MARDEREYLRIVVLQVGLVLGVVSLVTGIILSCTYITIDGYEIVKDYTDCARSETLPNQTKCKDTLNATGEECKCYISINITEPMKGHVTVFYELESYDNKYSQSRDEEQLSGHLSLEPSESCGSYTYACTGAGKKPIAPCGRYADALFNDTFTLQNNNVYVNRFETGLISEDDKKQFHNPFSAGNLSQAFEGFDKPTNWRINVWEFDTNNPDNNGFQNEAFIVWMNTELKRKPAWRTDGLSAGNYTLRVNYAYPPALYDGPRKVIISSVQECVNLTQFCFGVALSVIGSLVSIVAGLILFILKWRK